MNCRNLFVRYFSKTFRSTTRGAAGVAPIAASPAPAPAPAAMHHQHQQTSGLEAALPQRKKVELDPATLLQKNICGINQLRKREKLDCDGTAEGKTGELPTEAPTKRLAGCTNKQSILDPTDVNQKGIVDPRENCSTNKMHLGFVERNAILDPPLIYLYVSEPEPYPFKEVRLMEEDVPELDKNPLCTTKESKRRKKSSNRVPCGGDPHDCPCKTGKWEYPTPISSKPKKQSYIPEFYKLNEAIGSFSQNPEAFKDGPCPKKPPPPEETCDPNEKPISSSKSLDIFTGNYPDYKREVTVDAPITNTIRCEGEEDCKKKEKPKKRKKKGRCRNEEKGCPCKEEGGWEYAPKCPPPPPPKKKCYIPDFYADNEEIGSNCYPGTAPPKTEKKVEEPCEE